MIEVLKSETTNLHYDKAARAFTGRVKFDYRRFGDDQIYSANVVTRVNVRPDAHLAWIEESLLARAISVVRDGNAQIENNSASIFEQLRSREMPRHDASRKGLFANLRMAKTIALGGNAAALA